MTARSFILGLLSAIPACAAAAQLPPAGTRVRVTAPQLVVPVIGSFQAIRTDTLVVLEEGPAASIWSVPLQTVQRIELFDGIHGGDLGRATRFALVGGVGGAVVGVLTSLVLQNSSGDRYNKAASAGVGAGVGGLIAGFIGYRHPHEVWTPITLPRRTAVAPRSGAPAGLREGRER